jgi:hypothetical protein
VAQKSLEMKAVPGFGVPACRRTRLSDVAEGVWDERPEKKCTRKIYSNGFAGGTLVYTTFDRKVKMMEIPPKKKVLAECRPTRRNRSSGCGARAI